MGNRENRLTLHFVNFWRPATTEAAHGAVSAATVVGGLGTPLLMVAALPKTRSDSPKDRMADFRKHILRPPRRQRCRFRLRDAVMPPITLVLRHQPLLNVGSPRTSCSDHPPNITNGTTARNTNRR
jgi:hypothetical protein